MREAVKWMRRIRKLAVAGVLATGLAAAPSMAAEGDEPRPYDDSPCAAESAKHCSHVAPGTRTIFDCLSIIRKRGGTSKECATFVDGVKAERQAAAKAKMDAYRKACAKDQKKLCGEFDRQIAINGCLNRRRSELSQQCDALLPRRGSYKGPGNYRFKDGSEPEDWDLKQAMRSRPRRTRAMLEAEGKPVPDVVPRNKGRRANPDAAAQAAPKPAVEVDPAQIEWMKEQVEALQKKLEAEKAADAAGTASETATEAEQGGENAPAAP